MTADDSRAQREKRRASLVSVVVVLALILLKVSVSLLTGSLGILAQVADSVLDMVAAIVALFAVRVAGRPPDAEHPYGHGKVENLAALAEVLLLLVTCGWIVYEAIRRLFFQPVAIEAGLWGVGVMLLSIVASIWLAGYLMKVARRYQSQSLEGNALNFRTDVLSSSVVLLGLVLVSLSNYLGPEWSWLGRADAVAALVVALLVLRVSLGLGWRAVTELMDAAPPGLSERIADEARGVPGVEDVGPVRVRQSGADTFVDLTAKVGRSVSLEEAHRIATAVETRVAGSIGAGDVIVHVDPVRHADESPSQTVGAAAGRLGLRVHNVHAHELQGQYFLDFHVEVPPELTLAQAHERVGQLETAVRAELPYVDDIHTHIEPMAVSVSAAALEQEEDDRLRGQIFEVVRGVAGLHSCHKLFVRPSPHGYDIVLHCLADPELPVAEAHRLADQAEKELQAQVPGIGQVLIRVEPEGGS